MQSVTAVSLFMVVFQVFFEKGNKRESEISNTVALIDNMFQEGGQHHCAHILQKTEYHNCILILKL